MKQIWRSLFLTIPLATLASFILITTVRAQSKITPDNSLGGESSVVTPNVVIKGLPSERIDGGATRGANLFHSFQEFNVDAGRGAYFSNPAGIQNILSRVTGGNPSNIFGKLGVLGNANLFFINPNGIIFGPSSSLDVNGSFFASTANSLVFANGFEFSATNPQAPPLLTVNIPIGLRFRDHPGSITNRSIAVDASNNPVGLQVPSGNTLALVGGDVISSDGGRLTAAGGRIELGGLAGAGTVGLETTGNTFRLNFPSNSLLSNVTLADDARVSVRGNGGGDIAVNTNIFTATNGGLLVGGTKGTGNGGDISVNSNEFNISGIGQSGADSGLYQQVTANASGNAGNITVNTNSFNASSSALVENSVLPQGMGNAGNIKITAGSVAINSGATISSTTFGKGNAGSVTINAHDRVSLDGVGSDGSPSGAFSTVDSGAMGNGGSISITTGSLSLTNGAQLQSLTLGQGDAGSVTINARDRVSLDGVGSNGLSSGAFSTVESGAIGNGGSISITTGSLSLTNNAVLNASTAGTGNAGSIFVRTSGAVSLANAAIYSEVRTGSVGKGGDLNISAGSLSLTDGTQLSASTFGQGNAGSVLIQAKDAISLAGKGTAIFSTVQSGAVGKGGNINIQSGEFSLTDGAQLVTTVLGASDTLPGGRGNAGNVNIKVRDRVTISNSNVNNDSSTQISSPVGPGAVGNGGNIDIQARAISLTNAALFNSTLGQGNAGSISLQATDSVSLVNGNFFNGVGTGAVGNGGNIDIHARAISLTNGSQLFIGSGGQGNSGSISVQASDSVSLANRSSITSSVQGGVGNSGNIDIQAGSLSLTDNSFLNAFTNEQGDAGSITVRATDSVSLTNGSNFTNSVLNRGVGKGGDITIQSGSLSLTNGAQLLAYTSGQGDAGNVTINARDQVSLDGVGSDALSTVGSGAVGKGGNINVTTGSLKLTNGAALKASTAGNGNAGNIKVNTTDSIFIADRAQVSVDSQGQGQGGNIDIRGNILTLDLGQISASTSTPVNGGNINLNLQDSLRLRHNSLISASAGNPQSAGNGGNITINAPFVISFPSNNDIIANAFNGSGGKITINAIRFGINPLSLADLERLSPVDRDPREVPTSDITAFSLQNPSLSGTVSINSPDVDPSRGLIELPVNVVDPTTLIAQNPCQRGVGSAFVITGRGGLPSNPNQALTSDNVRVDLVTSGSSQRNSASTTVNLPSTTPTVKRLVPAQGWVFNDKGQVVLTAYDPTNTGSQRSWQQPASCAKR